MTLVKAQLVADTDSKSAVAHKVPVVGLSHAVDLGENEALQRRDGNVAGKSLERMEPVIFEKCRILIGSRLHVGSLVFLCLD